MDAAERWADALARWAIPDHILEAAPESPYGFPVHIFRHAAEEASGRETPTVHRALDALPNGGSVLDVGCGAGAASLALLPRPATVIGVDEMTGMLEAFAEKAAAAALDHTEIEGRWPDAAGRTPAADVVVCNHVFYNVGDLDDFAARLTDHARARVVVEIPTEHPLAWMNPLWEELHGLERPDRPVLDDAVAVLEELGLDVGVDRWNGPFRLHDADPDAITGFVRKRLCLGEERDPDIRRALDRHPVPEKRDLATLWWAGTA